MLAKYPQMIEFLEIPQLLNNCIRTNYYDDALKICNFVSKICIRYKVVAPIFEVCLLLFLTLLDEQHINFTFLTEYVS